MGSSDRRSGFAPVGGAFKGHVKGRDTAARFGGEEFAVIFPQTELAASKTVAEQIRQIVENKKIVKKSTGEGLGRITMSFDVVQFPPVKISLTCCDVSVRSGRVFEVLGFQFHGIHPLEPYFSVIPASNSTA